MTATEPRTRPLVEVVYRPAGRDTATPAVIYTYTDQEGRPGWSCRACRTGRVKPTQAQLLQSMADHVAHPRHQHLAADWARLRETVTELLRILGALRCG